MLKKITIRLLLLLLLIAVSNVVYSLFFYKNDFKEYTPQLYALSNTADSADVFYFGESSNTTFVPSDSVSKSISALTAQFFPKLKFININKEATHAGIYKVWLRVFDEKKKYPKAVIVTLNMRSFNAAWIHSVLENSLQEELIFAKPFPPLVNRFLLSLQAFSHLTDDEAEKLTLRDWREKQLQFPYKTDYSTVKDWDDKMANGGYLNEDGSWNQPKIELACHYIKAYALQIDSANVRIRDLDEIADWCEQRHVKLYLNLMAENVQYADSLVGKDLVFLMRRNHDYLLNRYNGGNSKVVDNFELVDGKLFIDQNWTTEHYMLKGRMHIAKNVAETLKHDFESEFVKAY